MDRRSDSEDPWFVEIPDQGWPAGSHDRGLSKPKVNFPI